MRNVASYLSQQKPKAREAANKELMPLGAKIYRVGNPVTHVPACMACHGPAGKGIPDQFPRVGSQHAAYIAKQLVISRRHRSQERHHDRCGFPHD
jgi:cytochrome c553